MLFTSSFPALFEKQVCGLLDQTLSVAYTEEIRSIDLVNWYLRNCSLSIRLFEFSLGVSCVTRGVRGVLQLDQQTYN